MDRQQIDKQLSYCPVAWQAKHNPQQIALQTDKQSITFGELHLQVESVTLQLKALSMKEADRLACIATNSVALVLLQLACLRCGFIFCPINAKFNEAEVNKRLAVLKTPFIWHQDNEKNNLAVNFDLELAKTAKQSEIDLEAFSIDKFNVISIIFTSGSRRST
ncbi:AMP-binding protein [Psychromonas sp. KJ10-10]|uniref:AMP-binding protein n=1 Tax=Psychromonas sp. KJ10-10 TaxID=3391823 RepID=UPI0039B56095